MANRYWVGGTGNWTDTAHWSDTSGGTGGFSVPTVFDDVYLDGNSGSGTITDATTIQTSALNCTGYTGTLNVGACQIRGSLTLNSSMTFSAFGNMGFQCVLGNTINITSAGKTFGGSASFETASGASGTINLLDDFVCTTGITIPYSVTLNTNNHNITCRTFQSNTNSIRTFNLGSGTLTITGTGNVFYFNQGTYTFNAGTGNIVLTDTTTTARNIGVGSTAPVALTFNKITIGGTTGTSNTSFVGAGHTINELASTKTVAHTITFLSSTTTTIGTWSVNGTAGNLVSIRASTAGTQATLAKSGGGTVTADYLNIKDSAATPSSTWTATNSTDSGNNTGWSFGAAGSNSLLFGSNF